MTDQLTKDALLRKDIAHAIAKLTEGCASADAGTIRFSGGRVTNLNIDPGDGRAAHFSLVLDSVDINQLTVILGLLKRPPTIDITALTLEGDGTTVALTKREDERA